jgi:hypothetical protein
VNVDERIRTTLGIEAASVTPPGVDLVALRTQADRVRRRRRGAAVSVAAAAVAAVVGIGMWLAPHPDTEPSPAPRPGAVKLPIGTPPHDAVWYDADGLHHGTDVYPVPDDATPLSIALVRGGAVYLVPTTLHIRYPPWDGRARDIGRGSREAGWKLGPGSDPEGSVAAWFDGTDLVMYDTARGSEVARVSERGHRVMPFYENEFGTRFRYVDDRGVVWDARDGRVLMFDRTTGRTTTVSRVSHRAHTPYVVDWRPGLRAWDSNDDAHAAVLTRADGSVLFSGSLGSGPVRFSPDGGYLVTLDRPQDDDLSTDVAAPVLVDTTDGTSWRAVASTSDASVGWGYGHTLMYLQSGGTGAFDAPAPLIVYDAATRHLVSVEHRGEVVLPAN